VKLEPRTFTLSDLLADVEAGEFGLPEFQRPWKWQPSQIVSLLDSIARGWPVGSFLLLRANGGSVFQHRDLDSAPHADNPTYLILDGQQRTTAIYQAFGDHAEEVYYLDVNELLDSDELDEGDIRYLKKSRFYKKYPNVQSEAQAGIVPVYRLITRSGFSDWLKHVDPEKQSSTSAAIEKLLPGYDSFSIPAHALEGVGDEDLGAVAKIFETVNNTGLELKTFDLMVARLYPTFLLKNQWQEALDKYEVFEQFGLRLEHGIEVLKLIALREYLRQRSLPRDQRKVRGVREGDVLKLTRDAVTAQWEPAVKSYAEALEFARDRGGAVRPALLPARSMLLVIANALHPLTTRRHGFEDELEKWYWASLFTQAYAQGANTQATRDAERVAAWQVDAAATPDVVAHFALDASALLDGRARNEQLLVGLLGSSVVRGAQDWLTGARFDATTELLEFHHIYPDDLMSAHYPQPVNPIANYALLTKSSNAGLRDKLPRDVLLEPAFKTQYLNGHGGLSEGLLAIDTTSDPHAVIDSFLRSRAEALRRLVYETVGAPLPAAPPIEPE